jgi:hypothetical protein
MKCKHENADHLMPGDWFQRWDCDDPGAPVAVEQFRCIDCGAWLSLGESNDSSDAVKTELRAARLAADYSNLDQFVGYEWYGRLDAGGTRSGLTNLQTGDLFDYRCGFLACCIATHEEP